MIAPIRHPATAPINTPYNNMADTDAALERVRTRLIPEAVRRTMLGRMSDGMYLTWAVYGLDDKRQVEFLDRAWQELLVAITRRDG